MTMQGGGFRTFSPSPGLLSCRAGKIGRVPGAETDRPRSLPGEIPVPHAPRQRVSAALLAFRAVPGPTPGRGIYYLRSPVTDGGGTHVSRHPRGLCTAIQTRSSGFDSRADGSWVR